MGDENNDYCSLISRERVYLYKTFLKLKTSCMSLHIFTLPFPKGISLVLSCVRASKWFSGNRSI